jgi:hypothetical protein
MKWITVVALLVFVAGLALVVLYWKITQNGKKEFVISLTIEPEPTIRATVYLALWVGLIALIVLLPLPVFGVVWLVAALGGCWWLLYITFRGFK